MKHKKRKKRPEPPRYYDYDTDNCWCCDHRSGCSGCKRLKRYIHDIPDQSKEALENRRIKKELEWIPGRTYSEVSDT